MGRRRGWETDFENFEIDSAHDWEWEMGGGKWMLYELVADRSGKDAEDGLVGSIGLVLTCCNSLQGRDLRA